MNAPNLWVIDSYETEVERMVREYNQSGERGTFVPWMAKHYWGC